jgi:hypothetical protein
MYIAKKVMANIIFGESVIQVNKKNSSTFQIRYFEGAKPVKNYLFRKLPDGSYETNDKISHKVQNAIVNCILLSSFSGQ